MNFDRLYFLDGALGTYLQKLESSSLELPEVINLKSPDVIIDIHKQYLAAGADIITANTFGANRYKLKYYTVEEVIRAAVRNAKAAINDCGYKNKYVALDIGPTGRLLKPFGDLDFDTCVDVFREMIVYGEAEGADIILIETMMDLTEARAAVIAAKKYSKLPVFCTLTFNENGRTITGADVLTMVNVLESLSVDALGLNCTLEPSLMLPVVKTLLSCTVLPVIFQPNAGVPLLKNNIAVYDVDENIFADSMRQIALAGANILGGCCGTEPKHIAKLICECKDIKPFNYGDIKAKENYVSSYSKTVAISDDTQYGNRLNCKQNKDFANDINNNDITSVVDYVLEDIDDECGIICINLDSEESKEAALFPEVLNMVQSITNTPVLIFTKHPFVLENALAHYSGRAAVQIHDCEAFKTVIEKYKPVLIAGGKI